MNSPYAGALTGRWLSAFYQFITATFLFTKAPTSFAQTIAGARFHREQMAR